MKKIKVIGAGLAGCEAAFFLAERGVKVTLVDIKPQKYTPAHKSDDFAELVCSNSLKSNDIYGNAAGLLKEEMRIIGSLIISAADKTAVPAGGALAVDRNAFSALITERIKTHPNVEFVCREESDIDCAAPVIIATGPLTTDALSGAIKHLTGDELSFYDASAPIVAVDSIDKERSFKGDRYGKGGGDHINCPMNKEEYKAFIDALLTAERATLHEFEKVSVFEGCMPVEIMAARGEDTLRFGPLKPAGLDDPATGRWPYACLQLRREDESGTMYNLIGFQTNLKFAEQKRVFGMIPALKNAEFLRYGVMHRNTFINSPKVLNRDGSLKKHPNVFFAGQIIGVEGYVESAASGLIAAIYALSRLNGVKIPFFPEETVMGALMKYVSTENENFQPMNANFGILPPPEVCIRQKAERKKFMAETSLDKVKKFKKEILL